MRKHRTRSDLTYKPKGSSKRKKEELRRKAIEEERKLDSSEGKDKAIPSAKNSNKIAGSAIGTNRIIEEATVHEMQLEAGFKRALSGSGAWAKDPEKMSSVEEFRKIAKKRGAANYQPPQW